MSCWTVVWPLHTTRTSPLAKWRVVFLSKSPCPGSRLFNFLMFSHSLPLVATYSPSPAPLYLIASHVSSEAPHWGLRPSAANLFSDYLPWTMARGFVYNTHSMSRQMSNSLTEEKNSQKVIKHVSFLLFVSLFSSAMFLASCVFRFENHGPKNAINVRFRMTFLLFTF